MWQVYLYLANEHQVRERDARARERGRRWSFGRRARHVVPQSSGSQTRDVTTGTHRVH